MKYHCENCDGTGIINDDCEEEGTTGECLNCEGTGTVATCISRIKFGAHLRHRDELIALQHRDELIALQHEARRVISDCGKLLVCNPPHWSSYVAQLEKTIREIETRALELLP